mmetsp:Transcript_4411/g.11380  ORF Transcript_4411/g.11380 Transcript_4411/m.11380 type:complete len:99 (-) Transcript_4411:1224-1520(-)
MGFWSFTRYGITATMPIDYQQHRLARILQLLPFSCAAKSTSDCMFEQQIQSMCSFFSKRRYDFQTGAGTILLHINFGFYRNEKLKVGIFSVFDTSDEN